MTDVKYDAGLCERLEREAREDDAAVGRAPWRAVGLIVTCDCCPSGVVATCHQDEEAPAIARTRNNLRAMADQLAAARAEIERWKTLAEYHCATQNREVEPCEDGACSHTYDSWPAHSVTKRALEVDQCDDCGWTAVQVDAYRAARDKGGE